MSALVTSARLSHAVEVIRALGEAGHEVIASETFRTAPGLHFPYVKERILTAAPVFETLRRLHDKKRFVDRVHELDLPIAKTLTATSPEELVAATRQLDEYFARAAFSRGGVTLLTNTGPLAGAVKIAAGEPTPQNPWLVQDFVHGEDLCSMSVAHHGRLAAHCTYRHPLTIEHAGGIVFEAIDAPEALEVSRKIIEHQGYHGHVSCHWLRTEGGKLSLVECNPRPTAAIFTMDPWRYAEALFEPDFDAPYVTEAGRREQIDVAIVRYMFREPGDIPEDLHRLLDGTRDVYSQKGDRLPGLSVILSYAHVLAYRRRMHVSRHKHSDLMAAQFFDIECDGGEID